MGGYRETVVGGENGSGDKERDCGRYWGRERAGVMKVGQK